MAKKFSFLASQSSINSYFSLLSFCKQSVNYAVVADRHVKFKPKHKERYENKHNVKHNKFDCNKIETKGGNLTKRNCAHVIKDWALRQYGCPEFSEQWLN